MWDQIERLHPGNFGVDIMKSDVFGKGNFIKDMAMLGINVEFFRYTLLETNNKTQKNSRKIAVVFFFRICQNTCNKESTKIVVPSNNRFHSMPSHIDVCFLQISAIVKHVEICTSCERMIWGSIPPFPVTVAVVEI